MQVNTTVTLGDIVVALSLFGSVVSITLITGKKIFSTVRRIELSIVQLAAEHELLIKDYCDRNNLDPSDLATRVSTILDRRLGA